MLLREGNNNVNCKKPDGRQFSSLKL